MGSLFLISVYYLGNSARRNTLVGRILKEFIVALLVWVMIAALLAGYGKGHGFLILFWVSLVPFGYFLCLINLYWLIPAFEKKKKRISSYVAELVAAALIIAFPFLAIAASLRYERMLGILILYFVVATIASLAITWFIYWRNKEQIRQMLYLKKELGQAASSLQSLRSQINPHFLFNTLNTLYGLAINENAIKTGDGIQRLGDMMRFMLQDNQKDLIALASEVSYLRNYIYIQQLRVAASDNMQLTVDIQEPEEEYLVAPLLLISFVENAFKHGVRLQERSWISISLYVQNEVLYFEVHNSIHAQSKEATGKNDTGIGLENVRERLNLLYPGKHHLAISEDEGGYGICLTLNL
ncbi:MAG TPA: histidine kinase [Chitinophagaceae bacterium]|nr:histidine kinase [Chitinophagaceae bacterium]